jgi:hypothetical protein
MENSEFEINELKDIIINDQKLKDIIESKNFNVHLCYDDGQYILSLNLFNVKTQELLKNMTIFASDRSYYAAFYENNKETIALENVTYKTLREFILEKFQIILPKLNLVKEGYQYV